MRVSNFWNIKDYTDQSIFIIKTDVEFSFGKIYWTTPNIRNGQKKDKLIL